MKRFSILMLGGAVLVSVLYLLTRTGEQTSVGAAEKKLAETESFANEPATVPETKQVRPLVSSGNTASVVSPPSMPPGVTEPILVPDPLVQTVTHSIEDFSWGEFKNTVVKESLQMLSAEEGVGIFISARNLGHQSFDYIKISYEDLIPSDSILKLKLRLMSSLEWSEWQELAPGDLSRDIRLDNPASGWQYQLTFSAPSIEFTPKVQSVTVVSSQKAVALDKPQE